MNKEKYIFALGFFDGVHLGHQALLSQCRRLAVETEAETAAITFDRHPLAALTSEYPPLLSTLSDRVQLLRRFGIATVITLATGSAVMQTPWQAFLERLLAQGAAGFVCGDDFRFGHRGLGTAETLREFCAERGLPCVIVPEQTIEGRRISSTHIRSLLEAGDLAAAERFLGHRHIFTGQVIHGKGLGRTIGIPTANLQVLQGVILPKNGVYACRALVNGEAYAAVTNIGIRPTVSGVGVTVEPWLLDFSGDLYGREVTLEFVKFLREERRFASLEELQAEIRRNAHQTKQLLL